MCLEDFQLLDKEPFDNSIIKRYFWKIYLQQGGQLNQSYQKVEFIFGEKNNYHQIGNSYLEFDITVRNPAFNFDSINPIRLTNNALAYCFKEARLGVTSSSDLEHNEYVGQISPIMSSITSKDGDLLSQFDKIIEEIGATDLETLVSILSTSLHKMLIVDHIEANRGKKRSFTTRAYIWFL